MKKVNNKIVSGIVAGIILITTTIRVDAQDAVSQKKFEAGFRLMPTFSSIEMKTSTGGTVKGSTSLGFGVAALLGFNISDHISIQGELIYSSISQKSKENNLDRKINLRYVNIPLLLSLNTGKSKVVNLNFVGGPQVGINVGSSMTISGNPDLNNDQAVLSVKKSDLGLAYGAGVDFALNALHTIRLGLGYRGVFGLLDISNNSKTVTNDSYYVLDRTHIKTNSIYTGLSVMF